MLSTLTYFLSCQVLQKIFAIRRPKLLMILKEHKEFKTGNQPEKDFTGKSCQRFPRQSKWNAPGTVSYASVFKSLLLCKSVLPIFPLLKSSAPATFFQSKLSMV